jgi:hypothetical protein
VVLADSGYWHTEQIQRLTWSVSEWSRHFLFPS